MRLLAITIISLFCSSCGDEISASASETEKSVPVTPEAKKSHPLVTTLEGELPILLSAPHGGREMPPGVLPRQGKKVSHFNTKADADTDQLTEELAAAIAEITGKRPYVVIARFHRKFIDANRPPESAYETDEAKPVYDAYQHALADARRKIMDRWGSGILLDIHGQAAEAETIFRGTQDGETTAHLVSRFGKEALTGEKSLFGQLAKLGFKVSPAAGTEEKESKYTGGHIVTTYGSSSGGTFDAIQLELGNDLRSDSVRTQTANRMAHAITTFANDFLPAKEAAGSTRAEPQPPGKIIVGVYHDVGAGPSVNDLTRALDGFGSVTYRKLMAGDIKAGKLKEVDVLIQPGGSGGGQGRHLGEDGRDKIREFVRQGGGYVGICAGAYLASADYKWSLYILDAKVVDRDHWARGKGTVEIQLSEQGKQLLKNPNDQLKIHYAQGPLLAPAHNPEIPDYEILATFKTEMALNGAPKGVMPGTTAAARGKFGNGRVLCFSPHPEMTEGLDDLVQQAIHHVNQGSSKASVNP
jgi:N-formylglutamate amidohydrolase/glutamine amidotransferase PdxT